MIHKAEPNPGHYAIADLLLVVGTSAVVYPIASIPFEIKGRGGRIIEVNPDETPVSPIADVVIRGPAGGVLPALVGDLARDG